MAHVRATTASNLGVYFRPHLLYIYGFEKKNGFRFLVFWYFRFGFGDFGDQTPGRGLNIWFFGPASLCPKN